MHNYFSDQKLLVSYIEDAAVKWNHKTLAIGGVVTGKISIVQEYGAVVELSDAQHAGFTGFVMKYQCDTPLKELAVCESSRDTKDVRERERERLQTNP
jgi:DNA-directed RNA polymerase subunit E'/Rpb7